VRGWRFLSLALLLCLGTASVAVAQETRGNLKGKVVNRTSNKPVPGQEVKLDLFLGTQKVEVRESITDKAGNFVFKNLPLGENSSALVYTQFEGAEYSTWVRLDKEKLKPITLDIYNSSTDGSKVQITEYYVQVETTNNVSRVTEFIVIQNRGKTSFALDNSNKEKPLGLVLALPQSYQELELIEGLMQCCSRIEENKIYSFMSIPPGDNKIVFSYKLPESRVDLSREVPFDTANFFLVVANLGVQVDSKRLISQGVQEHETAPFQLFMGNNLKRGEVIDIQLSGLPTQSPFQKAGIVAVAIALAGGIAIFLLRKRKEELGEVVVEKGEGVSEDKFRDDMKRLYLEFISRLDELHEDGEISEEVYQTFREEYKNKLGQLLEEQ
jgi:hypothetical protein